MHNMFDLILKYSKIILNYLMEYNKKLTLQ